eukprot:TRINITY_DN5549_c0_g1_i1.p1 TRINITY_DN5549_c0_g1~~TRINITY_DN5549_c0_g1_i1.p1  ORF type:complete len:469 (+),score=141.94 TRINITY_DN5549_c0_g1_i1:86-1492(+)
MGPPKYVFVNGIMQQNPAWAKEQAGGGSGGTPQPSAPPMALAVISSLEDAAEAGAVQQAATGEAMRMPEATQEAVTAMQGDAYVEMFQAPQPLEGGEVVDKLTQHFAKYEVPLGMLNKLRGLSEYSLNFMVDDSGSMTLDTDEEVAKAGDWMAANYFQHRLGGRRVMTRWEEAEDRVHTIVDLVTYVPTGPIRISFFNRPSCLTLSRGGVMPEEFVHDAHRQIRAAFGSSPPSGRTPTKAVLQGAFQLPPMTMHYLFTDGAPSDSAGVRRADDDGAYVAFPEIEALVMHRRGANQHPITFVSCSDEDSDVKWMKVLEEEAPYAAEIDDFVAERNEVLHDQGPYFPFTRGFWLVCLLVAAINPSDLDAMDEHAPFSKMTMDNLLGRVLTEQDYTHYFRAHPQEPVVRRHYQEFATARATGKQIWQRHGLRPVQRQPTTRTFTASTDAVSKRTGYRGYTNQKSECACTIC